MNTNFVSAWLALSVLCTVRAAAAEKPNVIIVLTDDQGYGDLSCHGNPVLKTPNLDRFHAGSVRFTDFHVSSLCAPTRAALLTGRDALRAGVWSTTTDRSILLAGLPTLADLFAAGGYATAMFGKWHLGDAPPYRPSDRGFSESLHAPGGMIGMVDDSWGSDVMNPVFFHNNRPETFEGYREDILFAEAMRWMDAQRKTAAPFFVYLATFAPHGPHWAPENDTAPYRHLDKNSKRNPVAGFFGMLANIDGNFGKLEAFLEKTGLAENTIVIFLGDNGGTAGVRIHNAGMRGSKGNPEEGGHRVPFFIRWPKGGLDGGRDIAELAAHIDVMPTLAELCGLSDILPAGIDGISLVPLLRGSCDPLPTRHLFVRRDEQLKNDPDFRPEIFGKSSAVLSGKWRLIGGSELYDISADPGQMTDIAASYPEVVRPMREAQEAFWAEVYPGTFDGPRPIRLGGGEDVKITPMLGRPLNRDAVARQRQVRDGTPSQTEWSVEVASPGTYRIECRRWPREADAAMTAALPPLSGTLVNEPKGKALPVASVRLHVGDKEWVQPVSEGEKFVAFDVPLEAGTCKLTARMLDASGREIADAYFVYISKS